MTLLKFKIVFIHGFGFNPDCWHKSIFQSLTKNTSYHNYCIPGFGNKPFQDNSFKEISTDIVDNYLTDDCINIIVGHSMGGYLALELFNTYPNIVQGIILVNSHPWSDTDKTKEARTKQVSFLNRQPVERYLRKFYTTIDPDNSELLFDQYSSHLSSKTLSHYHLQMRDRPNYINLMNDDRVVFGIILGKNDDIVHYQNTRKLIKENSTHIYIENEGKHITPIQYPKDITQGIEEMKDYFNFLLL